MTAAGTKIQKVHLAAETGKVKMSYVIARKGLDLHWVESKAAIRHCGQANAWLVGYLNGF